MTPARQVFVAPPLLPRYALLGLWKLSKSLAVLCKSSSKNHGKSLAVLFINRKKGTKSFEESSTNINNY